MTLVNRLIKESRPDENGKRPDHLKINRGQVRQIAAHAHSLAVGTKKHSIEEIEAMILEGKFWMCGIPLRVG